MSRERLLPLLFLSLVIVPSSLRANAPTAREIVVSPTGDDSATGSPDAPLRSLRKALALAQPGDVIQLRAGEYEGGVKTRCAGVRIVGNEAIIRGPESDRAIEILHDRTTLEGITVEGADIGIWLFGVSGCVLEGLTIRDIGGEGIRIKNQSCDNIVRNCQFERMGRTGFDVVKGKKNGEGIYIGTAPEQRSKNKPPDVPDRCTGNIVEDCTFDTEAAEAVDIKEDSEGNVVRRCVGEDSRDPDGAIFGSRGDANRFEECVALGGKGHGFRFGGDTVKKGKFGQTADRTYGANNVMRDCRAGDNALWGAAPMVKPQDIDASNVFESNGQGDVKP